ncbi:hypothetical protein BLNAU_6287 [Blattamonas nauphoetae]|uniref:Zonadhesin n=1 Tax=Blattamonas nauphoetae TaxID=2049346 RepID=A0ABQ9Y4Y8_9EUKA|nr:hypothetical protein BLNAU_6287 [Blattamonas nauphoetae]
MSVLYAILLVLHALPEQYVGATMSFVKDSPTIEQTEHLKAIFADAFQKIALDSIFGEDEVTPPEIDETPVKQVEQTPTETEPIEPKSDLPEQTPVVTEDTPEPQKPESEEEIPTDAPSPVEIADEPTKADETPIEEEKPTVVETVEQEDVTSPPAEDIDVDVSPIPTEDGTDPLRTSNGNSVQKPVIIFLENSLSNQYINYRAFRALTTKPAKSDIYENIKYKPGLPKFTKSIKDRVNNQLKIDGQKVKQIELYCSDVNGAICKSAIAEFEVEPKDARLINSAENDDIVFDKETIYLIALDISLSEKPVDPVEPEEPKTEEPEAEESDVDQKKDDEQTDVQKDVVDDETETEKTDEVIAEDVEPTKVDEQPEEQETEKAEEIEQEPSTPKIVEKEDEPAADEPTEEKTEVEEKEEEETTPDTEEEPVSNDEDSSETDAEPIVPVPEKEEEIEQVESEKPEEEQPEQKEDPKETIPEETEDDKKEEDVTDDQTIEPKEEEKEDAPSETESPITPPVIPTPTVVAAASAGSVKLPESQYGHLQSIDTLIKAISEKVDEFEVIITSESLTVPSHRNFLGMNEAIFTGLVFLFLFIGIIYAIVMLALSAQSSGDMEADENITHAINAAKAKKEN